MININILIICFNRLENLKKILKQIFLINNYNVKIYVSIDGPRDKLDIKSINNIRNLFESYNSDKLIKIRLLKKNIGCGRHCSSAISWFFDQVDEGLILEDDIEFNLINIGFFTEKLNQFRFETNVFGISGFPYLQIENEENNFFKSDYISIWGWATWKDRWSHYNLNLFENSNIFKIFYEILSYRRKIFPSLYWTLVLRLFSLGKIDGWDHQYMYSIWKNNGYFIFSNKRIFNNNGFDKNGTYMKNKPDWYDEIFKRSHKDTNFQKKYQDLIEKRIFKVNILQILKLIIKNIFYLNKRNSNKSEYQIINYN